MIAESEVIFIKDVSEINTQIALFPVYFIRLARANKTSKITSFTGTWLIKAFLDLDVLAHAIGPVICRARIVTGPCT